MYDGMATGHRGNTIGLGAIVPLTLRYYCGDPRWAIYVGGTLGPPQPPLSACQMSLLPCWGPLSRLAKRGGGGWKMDARDPQVGASQFPLLCRHQMLEPLYHPFEGRNRGMLLLEEVVA